MSFALTTEQILNRTKTVTRRLGWRNLKPGTLLCAVEKAQGIKKGELVRLCVIRVVDVRREPLRAIESGLGSDRVSEVNREGFSRMTSREFVAMFCQHMRCDADQIVTRIEFEYVDQKDACWRCAFRTPNVLGHIDAAHRDGLCRCACHGQEAYR